LLDDAVDEAEEDAGEEGGALPVLREGEVAGAQCEQGKPDEDKRKQRRDAVHQNEAERAMAEAGVIGDAAVKSAEESGERVFAEEKCEADDGSDEVADDDEMDKA
jgi:hypothetical protein